MTSEPLSLQLEEPGDDPLSDQICTILSDSLQPNSQVPMETTVTKLTELLPKGRPYSSEVGSFLQTCYELAELIPYRHVSMTKLVTIIDKCLKSSKFDTDEKMRYQKLETLRDWWDTNLPDDNPSKYINFQTFVALVYERDLMRGISLPIFAVQRALEEDEGKTPSGREACIKAALQHLLIGGENIYDGLGKGPKSQRTWQSWRGKIASITVQKSDCKDDVSSQELIEMAKQVVVKMDGIGNSKASSDGSSEIDSMGEGRK